jgi:tRNA (guanine-N7-)-methyltransferase
MAVYSIASVQMALFLALSCTTITHKAASFTYSKGSLLAKRRAVTAQYVTKEQIKIWRDKAGFGTVATLNKQEDDDAINKADSVPSLMSAATAAADISLHHEEHQNKVDLQNNDDNDSEDEEARYMPPWSLATQRTPSSKAFARFRQHVNPLSRRFQMPTDLPENWPYSDFTNVNLPLYLDIGCGKGGFLLELVGRRHGQDYPDGTDTYMNNTRLFADTTDEWLPPTMNYLGLEIRPGVSQYAQNRVEKRGLSGKLSFVGCNANVDLDRLLSLYNEAADNDREEQEGGGGGVGGRNNELKFVSIQFPDPHFKKSHTKRRVVTPALVTTLAKYMNPGGVVFLQSDIKEALEAMREKFVEDDGLVYFYEHNDNDKKIDDGQEEYGLANPLGIPTEREVSVLNQELPIYRTLFLRNDVSYPSKSSLLARNL